MTKDTDTNTIHWERGYRNHSAIYKGTEVGFIQLSPENYHPLEVTWQVSFPNASLVSGKCSSVHHAKYQIRLAFKNYITDLGNI